AGFIELKANLHVSDGIGGHQQFVTVEAREQVLRHVLVPRSFLLRVGETLLLPLSGESAVDDVDDLDKESRGACGGIKDNNERIGGLYPVGDFQASVFRGDLAPGDGGSEAVFEVKLGLQQFVDAAN